MSNPIVHAEIRSTDPDATRSFFGVCSGGTSRRVRFPITRTSTAESPTRCRPESAPSRVAGPLVTFFVGVDDIDAAVAVPSDSAARGASQPARVPGVAFALIADPAGQVVGLAQQG